MSDRKEFDFSEHVYAILRRRYRSAFIPYHEVYSYLGRRFCMKKLEIKDVLRSMEDGGYLEIKRRGIILVEQGLGKGEQNGDEKEPSSR